ncbi:MAG: hypothetical protein M3Q74_08000 [Pseudomonadota bacterium]|nr:hypothetical protein [Pseudomonadota bacterium]
MNRDQSHLATMATRISTSSAMNPGLMLCLMVCPLAFSVAASLFYFDQQWPATLFVLIGCWPLGITGWQLIRFTKQDPDRLQRERHVENMLQIRNHLAIKQDDLITEVPIAINLTDNPRLSGGHSE